MNTSRRTILSAGAALALPAWMASALTREQSGLTASEHENTTDSAAEKRVPTLADARARARAVGKPLLVLLADPDAESNSAGRAWGEFFALATEDAWLDLALVEVVCMPRAALGDFERARDPKVLWAVLFETDDASSPPRFVEGDLPARVWSRDDHEVQARERGAALAARIHAAVLPDEATWERRANQSMGSFDELSALSETHGQYEAVLEEGSIVRLTDLDRFAALARFRAPRRRLAELALAARVRVFERDPSGARWQTLSNYCPPCGMGFVAPESRYFLSFYAQ